jgi:hypothetical protein
MVGPDIVAPVRQQLDKITETISENVEGNFKLVVDLASAVLDIAVTSVALENAVNNALQGGSKAVVAGATGYRGCVFSNAVNCHELVFPQGFKAVYIYSPPPGFQSFTGLPLPIVTVVANRATGAISLDTPLFFPAIK